MILTLHGTGAGIPNRHRLASCISARFANGDRVVFDVGEGASRAMVRDGVDLDSIVTVAVSHMHADHWAGLPGLLTAWNAFDRVRPVDLFLPPGTEDFFARLFLEALQFPQKRAFELHAHRLRDVDLPDGWRLEPFATTHVDRLRDAAREHGIVPTAHGYRLRNGERSVVISADIGAVDDLNGQMDDADLLICESSHVEPLHVLEAASTAGVRRLIFTHVADEQSFPIHYDALNWCVAVDGYQVPV